MKVNFDNTEINFEVLKNRAYNYRWAEVTDGVIPLTAADSDFPCAKEIQEAVIKYIKDGYFCYTPKEGLPSFKEAISEYLHEIKKLSISPDNILPIDSVARGMYIIAEAFLSEGDEAIILDPVDYLFGLSVDRVKGKQVLWSIDANTGKLDIAGLEKLITKKTKMLCLCAPHNPVGRVYTREELTAIADIVVKHDLIVMNDEIWSDIIYPESEFISIGSINEEIAKRTITTHGFSKTYGLAGLRIGYIACPTKEIYEKILKMSDCLSTAGGITSISQIAGETALRECRYWLKDFLNHLTSQRDYALDFMKSEMKDITCIKPESTYLLFPNISAYNKTAEELQEYLLKEEKLAIIAGSVKFFGPGAKDHMRICFATSKDNLAEGLRRFKNGMDKIR